MNSIKCLQCGIVNWSADVECKRCGSLLTVQAKAAQVYASDPVESKGFFSGGIMVLIGVLAFAALTVVLSRVFQLIQGETAQIFAITFMFTGMALTVLAHLWLLVRIFEQSTGWGLASLFIPWVGLFAIAKFWEKTRRSFVAQLVCMGIAFVGYQIVPPS
ncbi:MAG: hypothetical protein QOE77_863 [Blastocatellia bacterium]|jgi:hypothetical protein|nr:hypothetical protein [Blastocatellia bacterium]